MIENSTHRRVDARALPQTRGLAQTLAYATAVALACLISFEITTHLLTRVHSVSAADDELGGMWATIATLFVFRTAYQQSVAAALSRTRATAVSFALCLLYLVVLPFHPWGMVLLIGVGAVLVDLGRASRGRGHDRDHHQGS